jgi:hypothetical protein
MNTPNDLPPFVCGEIKPGDITYEHDFIVNINNVTYTYCLELAFSGYRRGECVGIKSLLPGQKLTQRQSASYSQIVFDETGKQVAMADSSSAETELIDAVSTNLTNLANSSNTSSWNASASAGLDLGCFGSYGASGGGGETHADFTETFDSCVTNSASKVKNKKASSNMAAFNSLHTTTTTNTTSTDSVDVIENLSNKKIAVYYFYTMYKVYQSRLYIKRARNNWVMKPIVQMNSTIKQNVSMSTTYADERMLIGEGGKAKGTGTVPADSPAIGTRPDISGAVIGEDMLADRYMKMSPVTDTYTAINTTAQQNEALTKARAEAAAITLRRNTVVTKTLLLPIDGFHVTGENSKNEIDFS